MSAETQRWRETEREGSWGSASSDISYEFITATAATATPTTTATCTTITPYATTSICSTSAGASLCCLVAVLFSIVFVAVHSVILLMGIAVVLSRCGWLIRVFLAGVTPRHKVWS